MSSIKSIMINFVIATCFPMSWSGWISFPRSPGDLKAAVTAQRIVFGQKKERSMTSYPEASLERTDRWLDRAHVETTPRVSIY